MGIWAGLLAPLAGWTLDTEDLEAQKHLMDSEEQAVEACLDFHNPLLVVEVPLHQLRNQAAADYQTLSRNHSSTVQAGLMNVNSSQVLMITDLRDGSGSCHFYSLQGHFLNSVSGHAGGAWHFKTPVN